MRLIVNIYINIFSISLRITFYICVLYAVGYVCKQVYKLIRFDFTRNIKAYTNSACSTNALIFPKVKKQLFIVTSNREKRGIAVFQDKYLKRILKPDKQIN